MGADISNEEWERQIRKTWRHQSNENLLKIAAKLRREREHKERYGTYGTGRYVSSTEFYGSQRREIMAEIARRKKAGELAKTAGVARRQAAPSYGASGFFASPQRRRRTWW